MHLSSFSWQPLEYLLIKCHFCGLYSENYKWEILCGEFGRLNSVPIRLEASRQCPLLTYLDTRQMTWLLSCAET